MAVGWWAAWDPSHLAGSRPPRGIQTISWDSNHLAGSKPSRGIQTTSRDPHHLTGSTTPRGIQTTSRDPNQLAGSQTARLPFRILSKYLGGIRTRTRSLIPHADSWRLVGALCDPAAGLVNDPSDPTPLRSHTHPDRSQLGSCRSDPTRIPLESHSDPTPIPLRS